MEPEDTRLPEQPAQRPAGDDAGSRGGADELEVGLELGRRRVAALLPGERQVESQPGDEQQQAQRLVPEPGDVRRGARDVLAPPQGLAQLRRQRDRRVRLGEQTGEPARPLCEQPERQLSLLAGGRDDRGAPDRRVAVQVRAGPAAEAKRGPLELDTEPALELDHDLGCSIEQHRLEDEERAAHLLPDVGPQPPHLVRLPPDRERLADRVEQLAPADAARARPPQLLEAALDGTELVEHRAARGVARVHGQNEPAVELLERMAPLAGG